MSPGVVPPRPTPRERYTTRVEVISAPNVWDTVHVEVLDGVTVVAGYDRDYKMLQTFEPFRQGDRMFALVSPQYTATAVLDLHTGTIIASEEPDAAGFCPVGFYVPDWWDVHDERMNPDHEWPTGDFGFVWGCVWGDDQSWKVQYLDLSAVRDGVIRRDDRFGYVELATNAKLEPHEFIRCYSSDGRRRVEFHVRAHYDFPTGVHIPPEDPWS
jgi:hypothetical protein